MSTTKQRNGGNIKMKNYSDLSDIEKGWIREYNDWCKCGILALAIEMGMHYRDLLFQSGLDPSDYR